jgi:type I restriction enzyme S subunit
MSRDENIFSDSKTKGLIPELRFPEFKNDREWEEKELDKLTTKISDGIHTTPVYEDGGEYYFINGNNLTDGSIYIDEKTKRVSIEEYLKHKKDLNQSSILLSINGTIGNIAVYKNEKVILGKSACYININEKKVDKNFIIYFIQTEGIKSYFNSELTGSTIKNLSLKSIKETIIKVPTNPQEQQKIATCLSSLDEVIAAHSQRLDLLKDHKKGLMQNLFPTNSITNNQLRITDENDQFVIRNSKTRNCPKYRFKEFVNDGEWVENELSYFCFNISSGKDKNCEGGQFELYGSTGIIGKTETASCRGDYILVARVGANAGLLNRAKGNFGVTDNTLIIDLKKVDSIDFIHYNLERIGLNKLVFGSGQPLITGGQLKSLLIVSPKSEKEQQKIATCLSSLDAIITAQTEKIEQLKLHKKGLMQGLFPNSITR